MSGKNGIQSFAFVFCSVGCRDDATAILIIKLFDSLCHSGGGYTSTDDNNSPVYIFWQGFLIRGYGSLARKARLNIALHGNSDIAVLG